ncbi:MAG TPA: hypothetical protein VGL88_11760 [Pseudonocardiaceae bacterium]|jgi:hypothetical protein
MNNPTMDAVNQAHQSVIEYWTRLYAESDADNTRYSIKQGTDLQRQDQYLTNE